MPQLQRLDEGTIGHYLNTLFTLLAFWRLQYFILIPPRFSPECVNYQSAKNAGQLLVIIPSYHLEYSRKHPK